MDGANLFPLCALACALIGGALLGNGIYGIIRRRIAATAVLTQVDHHALGLWLRNGIGPLRRPARWLLTVASIRTRVDEAVSIAKERGMASTPEALLSSFLGAALLLFALGCLGGGSIAFGLVCVALFIGGSITAVKHITEKQSVQMREKVPDALRSFAVCFRSGLSLLQTLQQTSREMGGRLGRLFSTAAQRLEMGATTTEALALLQANRQVPELAFVAVALDIQHQSGGSLAPVLESARDSVESELDLMRSLRVQTAQAKLSASIVTIMPFVLAAFFSLMSPGFLAPFFSSIIGIALLALALGMQIAGVLIVRHMLSIDRRLS